MTDYDPTAYGTHIADAYDQLYAFLDGTDPTPLLADLAGTGPVLEFGIGTGRLALPLAAKGIEVHGVESSPEMIEQLRRKPGGADIPVVEGDFATTRAAGEFSLVFLAVNTIFALPSQDAQIACFRNAAAHLRPGGVFVVEAFVPGPDRFPAGDTIRVRDLQPDHVALEIASTDTVHQRIRTVQVHLTNDGLRMHPANHRYAWPMELDVMARVADLALRARWGDWDRAPFTRHSTSHISIYERQPAA